MDPKPKMSAKFFTETVSAEECCASCKYFESEGVLHPAEKRAGNMTGALEAIGTCRRYPPAIVKDVDSVSEKLVAKHPEVSVTVAKYEGQGDADFTAIEGDWMGSKPWCGEYTAAAKLVFIRFDEFGQ